MVHGRDLKMIKITERKVNSLMVLKADNSHLMHDKWILRCYTLRLQEELVCQLNIVGQPTLQANVQQW